MPARKRYKVLTDRGPWRKGSVITADDLGGHDLKQLVKRKLLAPAPTKGDG